MLSNDDNTGLVAGLRSLWFGKHVLELHVLPWRPSHCVGRALQTEFSATQSYTTLMNQKEGSLSVKLGPSSAVRAAGYT